MTTGSASGLGTSARTFRVAPEMHKPAPARRAGTKIGLDDTATLNIAARRRTAAAVKMNVAVARDKTPGHDGSGASSPGD